MQKANFPLPHVVQPSLIIRVSDYKLVIVQVKASIMTIVWLDIGKLNLQYLELLRLFHSHIQ